MVRAAVSRFAAMSAFACLVATSVVQAQVPWGQGQGGGSATPIGCSGINLLTTSVYTFPATNGSLAPFNDGDHITLTVSMNTATTSSVSIVGSASGTPVLAGPLIGAGSISYDVTNPLPPLSNGIGFFVNSVTPPSSFINITMTCTNSIPVWPPVVFLLAIASVLGLATLMLRRRQVQFA